MPKPEAKAGLLWNFHLSHDTETTSHGLHSFKLYFICLGADLAFRVNIYEVQYYTVKVGALYTSLFRLILLIYLRDEKKIKYLIFWNIIQGVFRLLTLRLFICAVAHLSFPFISFIMPIFLLKVFPLLKMRF